MKVRHEGVVEKGRIKLRNVAALNLQIAAFPSGTRVALTVEKWKKDRSDAQNRYYWGVVVKILADELGYFPEEMHDALKLEFLRKESKPLPTVRSTTSLSTEEFEDYLEKVRIMSLTKYEVRIPLPGEIAIDE